MIKALIIYTQFFSRIVIPMAVDISYLRRGLPFLTLFGLLLGLISGGFYFLMSLVLPGMVAWVLTLAFDVLLTGGFHLDALADTADGLFSSRKKERMLEIMKDSRIGSNGVLALILSMIGKAGLSLQLYRMTYAREGGGSGNFFSGSKTSHILLAQLLPLLLSLLVFSWRGLLAYSLVFLGAIGYRRFVYNKIDGHTGDTLGAYVEIAQLLYLLGLVVLG